MCERENLFLFWIENCRNTCIKSISDCQFDRRKYSADVKNDNLPPKITKKHPPKQKKPPKNKRAKQQQQQQQKRIL